MRSYVVLYQGLHTEKKILHFHSAIRIENFLNKFQTWKLNLEAFYPNDFIDSVSI